MTNNKNLFVEMANAVRFLSIDAIQRANSGHPGMPMGMADVATILFAEFLKFNPKDANWPDRDRFILSAGHGSMLLYSLLYLTGYKDIELEDLKKFRQLGSKTAGHPEYGELEGVETTTGPLGQGLANAVGMAIAQKIKAQKFGSDLVNHKIYCIAGDGCLMEGISQEAISIAGHLNLSNLIILWDNNNISIDGKVDIASSENMRMRFEACNFHVIEIDGHNFDEIRAALKEAQKATKPVMISCKTTIGFGSPNKAGSASCHGSPLGEAEILATRKALNWNHHPFDVPEDVLKEWKNAAKRSKADYDSWQERLEKSEHKEEFNRLEKGELPDFKKKLEKFKQKNFLDKPRQPTRKSSGDTLEMLCQEIPELIGGSADLTGSVNTKTSFMKAITKDDFSGRYIHYGVREHAMAAIMNGMALHKGIIPYSGTFLVFSDYMRPAIRLAALMKLQVIYILTHDSIGLGEDGPTHQPVEHLAALRAIPNLNVFRPADAAEVIGSFEQALSHKHTPSVIVLSRQDVGYFRSEYNSEGFGKFGCYILSNTALEIEPDVVIVATGSEVQIAIETKDILHKNGFAVRVVSMPCVELFAKQSPAYKNSILGGPDILKVGIEAGLYQGWHRYLGSDGIFIGMEGFGASGPAPELFEHFGITAKKAAEAITAELTSRRNRKKAAMKDMQDDFSDKEANEEESEEEEDEEDED